MKDKVKVIRKSNEVLVKATTFSQSGQPIYMTGGGGSSSRKRGVTEKVGSAIGGVAGRGVGVLGTLLGQHRSAGGFLNSALNNWERGRQVGQDVGGKAGRAVGGAVGVGAKAAYDMRGSPTQRLNRQFARMPQQGGSRITYRGQPIGRRGQVQVTGGSSRNTAASAVSDNNANRVLGAINSGGVRVIKPGQQVGQGPFNMNPLGVAVTGNPLPKEDMKTMSSQQEAEINQRMKRQSGKVPVVDTHPVQRNIEDAISDVQSQAVPHGVKADGSEALTLDRMGPAAAGAVSPLVHSDGAVGELNRGDKNMSLQEAYGKVSAGKTDGAVTQGSVGPLERGNSLLQGAGLAGTTPSPNQREANQQYERLQGTFSQEALNAPYMGSSFEGLEWKGEPMDMAFRLLKMMAFYR